ncbi:MAG: type II toxin-antitoxin system RelE/ParE family toxin [Rhodothermia bacterium]
MIKSFRDKKTERVFHRDSVRHLDGDIGRIARQKLLIINASERLDDLRIPPGNRLEKLSGDRKNQYSIRVNKQWRICFRWHDGDAHDVEIVDYH